MKYFETKTDDGRPVTVTYEMFPAERSVGINRPCAEIDVITDKDGKQVKLTDSEYDRLTAEAEQPKAAPAERPPSPPENPTVILRKHRDFDAEGPKPDKVAPDGQPQKVDVLTALAQMSLI